MAMAVRRARITARVQQLTDQSVNIPLVHRGRIEGCRVGQFGQAERPAGLTKS
jgi:hypothetical protein